MSSKPEPIARALDLPQARSIPELLEIRGDRRPDATAIGAPGRDSLSFHRLLSHTNEALKTLNALGIGRNDRVAVVVPNGPEIASAFLAISSGATFAPLNPTYGANEFDFYLSDLKAKALITPSGFDSPAIAVAEKRSIPVIELLPEVDCEAGIFSLETTARSYGIRSGFAEPEDIALILYTSGTTSRPKMVPLSHANLLASAAQIVATLQLIEKDRCLNVMPLFHIHGLVGAVLSSIMAGSSVICASSFDPEQFLTWLEQFRPTWYTAVPTLHQAVLSCARAQKERLRHSSVRFIRSSSAALPLRVMPELEDIFRVPVIEAYGMTEASHQIASNPLPPGTRKGRSVGLPVDVEVAAMDSEGNFLNGGQTGEIVIRGPAVISGYGNSPETNRQDFANGWFKTGDQGYFDKDGYLFITGRLKEIINRGGEKISPQEVDDTLMSHPAVAQAVTFAVPHPTLGEDVVAAIVLRKNVSVTEKDLQKFTASRLADFKIPRRILTLDKIPQGGSGKPQRLGMAEALGLLPAGAPRASAKTEFLAPRTPIEARLAETWGDVLGIKQIGLHDNFFDLGGDSIQAARIINQVCSTLHVNLSLASFFESPTIADQAALVEEMLQSRASKVEKTDDGLTLAEVERVPLSATQKRLWLFQQLNPDSIATARPVALLLTGHLDKAVLERSLSEMVRRHGILRTIYREQNGEPFQLVLPAQPVCLELEDLQHEKEWELKAKQIAIREAQKTTDLSKRAPFIPLLLRLGKRKHLLLVLTNHIAFDGWSEALLVQELSTLYAAYSHGRTPSLPDLPIQYTDFAVQQHRRLSRGELETHLPYWKKKLEGMPSTLSLPTISSGSNASLFVRSRRSFVLPSDLADRVEVLSRSEGATPFMTLLAAFQILLSRYSQQDDIAIGTVIAGRTQTETESLIGCFANLLVLRTDLSSQPTFRELLQKVRKTALEAYEHQEVPFERLIEALEPERRLNQTPLFQVLFELRNMPRVEKAEAAGMHLESLALDFNLGTWALMLQLSKGKDGFHCIFEFASELFHPDTIACMEKHYQTLLRSIIADPDQPITTLPMVTDQERNQLSAARKPTDRQYLPSICLHELFEKQVAKSPEKVAVKFEQQELTYRELNGRANQLAHHLKKYGVAPERLIAIYMERSIDMAVAILGVLKAGGAYVPLDRSYPRQRLAFMLEDAKPALVLTQERWAADLPEQFEHRLCLDRESSTIARESKENPTNGTMANNLAYVIYTSGSTGKPKGVLVSHSNVARLFQATQGRFRFDENDVWALFHSYAFDFSVWEMWGALLFGGRLVVTPYWVSRSPEAFYELLQNEKVTVLNQTPSAFRQLIRVEESITRLQALALRLVIFGGEALELQSLKPWFDRHGDQFPQLVNMYGITETTVHSTYKPITSADLNSTSGSVVGSPIHDLSIYILDRHLQPVPIGVSGEVHIAGPGVARGYLNRSELTAERFIPNPFGDRSAPRLYRSGDLARCLPNGDIEFLGRIDHQIKIRGFRIELGEIESALSRHPEVREAVVLAREELPENTRVVAYVAPKHGESLSIDDLRNHLKKWLPDYMLPSAYVTLESLPLTTNGKIDRRSLPEPDTTRPKNSFAPPRTPAEEQLAQIWRKLLRTSQIGIQDSFFDLGGHSLLLTQLASRILDAFQVRVPLRVLFDQSTIEEMTLAILERQVENTDQAKIDQMLRQVTQLSQEEVWQLLKASR